MITTLNLNRDKHIETLDIKKHISGKINRKKKEKWNIHLLFSILGVLFSLALCRAFLTFVIFLSFFPLFLFGPFFILFFIFNQCPEVTLCGLWYIKIKELCLDRSTHLFLVMFFLAHHRAPFCSEYFPLFSTHILVLFFSAAQVFSLGLLC